MAGERYIATWTGGVFVAGPALSGSAVLQRHVRKGELLPEGVESTSIDHLLREGLIRRATRWDGVEMTESESDDD